MVRIETLRHSHLQQVQGLINSHLSAVIPGWALPMGYIARRVRRNLDKSTVDPWVMEQKSLVALVNDRVRAAAQLLRHGAHTSYKDVGEISWLLAWPESPDAARAILTAAQEAMDGWGIAKESVWGEGLWVLPCVGVPDVWPHILDLLEQSGYTAEGRHQEAIYGGTLDPVPVPGDPPEKGMSLRRTLGRFGARFEAIVDGEAVGQCECCMDLSRGGLLPALAGWAELSEVETKRAWRNRGVGAWLMRHAVQWLRLGGYDRVVLCVAAEAESAGAGRFYQRFGWQPLARHTKGWSRRRA
jgi:GNAT superfamily N-acetyltransferase